ncbi:cyclin-B1-1-like [Silene latifolia]|uniref:cyclin-B1-1-like n=1 Tax=Silene latifolia TaxID=37657 RepID=UPI003D76F4C9
MYVYVYLFLYSFKIPPKRNALYARAENISIDEIVKMLEYQDALTEALKKFGKDKEVGVDFAKMSINIARFNSKEYMGTGTPILLDNWHMEMENKLNVVGRIRDYKCTQPDISEKMRLILVDWLIEVHSKFELRQETLYLTVNIIDCVLSMKAVSRKELQLVGIASMFIACKYEEIWAPEVNDFVQISENA